MNPRIPPPSELIGRAILTSDAGSLGLGRGRLRGPDVAHPFHGVSSVDLDPTSVFGRCLSYEPLLRDGQWFSHLTALELFGAPLPAAVDDSRLHLVVVWPRTAPRSRGIRGHALTTGSFESDVRLGFPVVSAADAWVQSAALLSREDVVAVGDFLLTGRRTGRHREPARATIEQLRAAARRTRGTRGAASVVWALPRVRVGPDSRPETRMRLLLAAARFAEPEIRHPIVVDGGLLLHPDLAFVAERVALEYEGDGHRTDRTTWLDDIERRELMEAAGWRVIRVTSRDIFEHPELFVIRVRRILRSRTPR